MFKKLGTIALTAALAVLGMSAPANAAGSDPVAGSVVNQNIQFVLPSSSTITVPAGVTSLSISRSWTPNANDLATMGGKTIALSVSVTKPDGTALAVTGLGPVSGLMANGNSNISITGSGKTPLSPVYPATTLTLPGDLTGYSSGYVGDNINISNYGANGQDVIPAGTWTVSVIPTLNGTPITETTSTWGGSWYTDTTSLNSVQNISMTFASASAVAPAGAIRAYLSANVCVDTGLIAAGDVLAGTVSVNGGAAQSSGYYNWKANGNTMRANGNSTVVAGDLTNGLYVSLSQSVSSPTAGTTYSAAYTVKNAAGTNVTGTCAPPTPAKPTIAYTNGAFQIGFVPTTAAQQFDCQLFDANDLTTAVQTASTWVSLGSPSGSCAFSSGTTVGHSYVAKVRANWNGYAYSDYSPASDALVKPATGYSITSTPSGITNVGGKLSRVSNTIARDGNALLASTVSDGGSGEFLLETEQSTFGVIASSTSFTLHHVTRTGIDSSWAGTGSAVIAVANPTMTFGGQGAVAWYGANHANWVFTYSTNDGMTNTNTVNIVTGTNATATTNTITVAQSKLDAACVTAYGAGFTTTPPQTSPAPPVPNLRPIAADTTAPLYVLNCLKPTASMPAYYPIAPVLVQVADANTVTVVKALMTPSATVNQAQVYYSANPSAGATDAALTMVVVQQLYDATHTTPATDSRVIMTMTPSLAFTTSTSTYTVGASEPSVVLAPLNDGITWGLLRSLTGTDLLKINGNTVTQTTIAPDAVTGYTSSNYGMPIGLQPGNATSLTLSRSSNPVGSIAMGVVDTATGALVTKEVATYTVSNGAGMLGSLFLANNNLYWLITDIAAPNNYSLYKWLDPNFHLTAQTITLANNNPTTLAAGGTATVHGTASSSLAVRYSSADTSVCTVNASTGVVTAVASTGNCVINLDQDGDQVTYDSAPTASVTLAVQKTAQTLSWNASPSSIAASGTLTVAATATSHLAVSYGSTDTSKCTVNASTGVVTPVASTGNCVVTADQAGNGTYSAATQITLTLAILQKTAQTITFANGSPTQITAGSTMTVSATASSSLAVTYGTTDHSVCTVTSAGVVSAVAGSTGNCVVTADQAGNATYAPASQATLTLAIQAAAPAKIAPTAPTVATKIAKGKSFTIALSATGGTATAGANANGLATTVTLGATAKGICSITPVKKAGKITAYTVKGLAVNATKCVVNVNIVGNNTYNSLTKTVKVNVTK